MTAALTADPLHWGHGAHSFEVFLEPTCPFSGRAFAKLKALLDHAGPENVTVKIRLQSQPWHMFSGILTRAILAASATSGGKEAAWAVMAAIFADIEAYEFKDHATGPNMLETPEHLLARVQTASGVDFRQTFDHPALDREIKWQCKYARQNGIHVSPTFMIDGLTQANIGSGDPVEAWAKPLDGPLR
jgi:protein-disulfide isomerase